MPLEWTNWSESEKLKYATKYGVKGSELSSKKLAELIEKYAGPERGSEYWRTVGKGYSLAGKGLSILYAIQEIKSLDELANDNLARQRILKRMVVDLAKASDSLYDPREYGRRPTGWEILQREGFPPGTGAGLPLPPGKYLKSAEELEGEIQDLLDNVLPGLERQRHCLTQVLGP